MTILMTLLAVIQGFAISLGVGSSTLAIANFFVAIADGTIDDNERRMMGIVYVVLRIAMMAILLTFAATQLWAWYSGTFALTPAVGATMVILAVLFGNAYLMTKHIVPSTIGPGLQAGSWYALGALQSVALVGVTFTFTTFLLAFAAWLALSNGIVNGIMAWLRSKRQTTA